MARSGWAALVVTILLVAGLGSEPALDAVADADRQAVPLLRSLTAFPAWNAGALGFDSDMYAAIGVKIAVLLLVIFVLGRAAGHVGTSFAAFLAGWGSLMIASAIAGVAYVLVADMLVLDGQLADAQGGAGAVVVDGLNNGVVFGLYTGWLVGLLVVFTARPGGLQAAGGWRASPPSRTLPVPPEPGAGVPATGTAAMGAVGAVGAIGAAPPPRVAEDMADMNLVPGMPSVTQPAVVAAPLGDHWATDPAASAPAWTHEPAPVIDEPVPRFAPQPQPQPQLQAQLQAQPQLQASLGGQDHWAQPPAPSPTPGPATGEDPWGPRPLSDPSMRSAPASAEPPAAEPPPSTEDQPFIPSGTWPRPVGGVVPEAASTPSGPIVPSGTWPPSSLDDPGSTPWPPSAAEQQEPMADPGLPPAAYEQPEYAGAAASADPAPPEPMPAPAPAAVEPEPVAPETGGGPAPARQPARPLWPASWPAETGGAYTGEHEVYRAEDVKRLTPEETADKDEGEPADDASTRFW